MYVGALEFDVLLGDVHSLKQKRSYLRPVIAELKRYGVAAAETGEQDLHRRGLIGVAAVSSDVAHVNEVLDECERAVARRPELDLLAARRRIYGPED